MHSAGNHEIEQQSVVTKFFNAYRVRLKNAHAASSSPSFQFYSVSNHRLLLWRWKHACKHSCGMQNPCGCCISAEHERC